MAKFVFYDFETTGISPKFDQALQFAAILTDENFNPIEEVDIRCCLSDYILPSPIALAVTGMTPELLLSPQMTQYDFALELTSIINRWSPAIWTGYNTIQFDENVLRQLFYQNLLPDLYLTSMNGNSRLDIMKAVYGCWGYDLVPPNIPEVGGKHTARLDTLAPHNGFNEHNAHDALGDVRATIFIARMIKDNHPDFWNQMMSNLNKKNLIEQLTTGKVHNLVERFGGGAPRIYKGVYCGTNKSNPNQVGFFDLDQIENFDLDSNDADLVSAAVENSPKIIRTLDLNKMPILSETADVAAEETQLVERIFGDKDLHDRVGHALANRYADREAPLLVEDKIYDGFYDYHHKGLLKQFHKTPWQDRLNIVNQMTDPRLKEMGERLLVLYAPGTVSEEIRSNFWGLVSDRWSGKVFYGDNDRSPGNTYESVQEDMKELMPGGKFEVSPDDFEAYQAFYESRQK